MASFEINISEFKEPRFRIRTLLDDIELVMDFDWNTRFNRWFLSIMDANETPLVMGICLAINTELITRFEIPNFPQGQLYLIDMAGNNQECGLDDLGERCVLIYSEAA